MDYILLLPHAGLPHIWLCSAAYEIPSCGDAGRCWRSLGMSWQRTSIAEEAPVSRALTAGNRACWRRRACPVRTWWLPVESRPHVVVEAAVERCPMTLWRPSRWSVAGQAVGSWPLSSCRSKGSDMSTAASIVHGRRRPTTASAHTYNVLTYLLTYFLHVNRKLSSDVTHSILVSEFCHSRQNWKRIFSGVHNDSRRPPGAVVAFSRFRRRDISDFTYLLTYLRGTKTIFLWAFHRTSPPYCFLKVKSYQV